MANRVRRSNESLLVWLRAIAIAVSTYYGMMGLRFPWVIGAIATSVVVGIVSVASVEVGVGLAILALSVAMATTNPVLAIVFLIFGTIGFRYMGNNGGRVFLLCALALAGAFLGPIWAAVALAGFLMGPGNAAFVGVVACLVVEIAGLVLGADAAFKPTFINSGTAALLEPAAGSGSFQFSAWLTSTIDKIDPSSLDKLFGAVGDAANPLALLVQPAIWGVAAALTAILVRHPRVKPSRIFVLGAVAAGTIMPAAFTAILAVLLKVPVAWSDLGLSVITSMLIAVGFAAVYDLVFAALPEPVPARVSQAGSMAAEDADVDELLRLIATAEEKLATQHTDTKVVMITDMKSFSRMTEEDGSIMTAKAIQRHRDLLLPIIEAHNGHGKSTGGDGLVAAFETSAEALEAACEMQTTLAAHNTAHSDEREMTVRIGLAHGEVVLDKGGRPFIGAALNLAARVMNLADGGQTFATGRVAGGAGPHTKTHSHGTFELKNIASPVEVFEVLWEPDQVPVDPRAHEA